MAIALAAVTAGVTPKTVHAAPEAALTPTPLPAWTATIQHYALPAPGSGSNVVAGVTVGPDQNLWVGENSVSASTPMTFEINQVTTAGAVTHTYTDPTTPSQAGCCAVGSDGALWYPVAQTYICPTCGYTAARVGRMTTAGSFSSYNLPTTFQSPGSMTSGPDGNLWMTGFQGGLAKMTTSGQVTQYATTHGNNDGITTGPDGNLWFTEATNRGIGRATPAGVVTEFVIPKNQQNPQTANDPRSITVGPDGALWFTEFFGNVIGRITTSGAFSFYPVPTTSAAPNGIVTGPDGNLWFTEQALGRIGRLDPHTGVITEIRGSSPSSQRGGPPSITTGPDGKLWFTETLPCTNGAGCPAVASLDPATVTPPPAACLTVTGNVTLTSDLGPCAGDGIDIAASNVTVNLNGHKVFSAAGTRYGDFAGIRFMNVSGDTVSGGGGEVTGFDGGVLLDRGSKNIITGLNVHDNVGTSNLFSSLLGDGIVAMHSSGNLISSNTIANNGYFDGIGLLGVGTDNNTIQSNTVENNNGTGLILNPFLEIENPDRGASLLGDNIINNTFSGNMGMGISNASNQHGSISGNTVSNNAMRGIGLSNLYFADPNTYMTVTGNTVSGNGANGIEAFALSNTITSNVSTGNGTGFGGGGFDLADIAPLTKQGACQNTWKGNTWGSGGYNRACVTVGGTGPNPPTAAAMTAPASPAPLANASVYAGGVGRRAAPA